MNEFNVELYIADGSDQKTLLSALSESETEEWKTAMEARALSVYYNRSITVTANQA